MNPEELQKLTDQLLKPGRRTPMTESVRKATHNDLPEKVGVYAIWEKEKPLYVGYAGKEQRSKPTALCGLKDRIDSHRNGTLYKSTLALGVWFHLIAPTLELEEHRKIRAGERNPSAETRDYIRAKLSYSFVVCATPAEARALERHILDHDKPELNRFSRLLKSKSVPV